MKCTHNDCFSCPYPDCILPDVKIPPESKRAKLKRQQKENYEAHKEEYRARALNYYYEHRDAKLAYQAEYDKRDYVRAKKHAYDLKYRAKHKEELNAKAKARYWAKKGVKK